MADGPRRRDALVAASLSFNVYFDHALDVRERPARPRAAGEVSAGAVAAIESGLLRASVSVLSTTGFAAAVIGLALVGPIVAYDRFHKRIPVGPIMMRACSMLIYFAVAAATGDVPGPV